MKKLFSIIAISLVIALVIPSVTSYASNNEGYVLYLGDSGNNYTGDFKTVADAIYSYQGSPTSITNTKNFFDNQFGNSDYFIESQGGGFDSSVSDCFSVVVNGGTDLRLIAFSVRYDSCEGLYIVSSTPFTLDTYNINTSNYSKTLRSSYSSAHISYNGEDVYACVQINSSSYIGNFGLSGMTITDNNNSSFGLGSLSNVYLRYSSIPLYSAYEDSQFNFQNTFMQFGTSYKALFSDELVTCINEKVNAFTLDGVQNGYDTGVGEPEVSVETNSNHMYFKNCSIGFCEPYNQNDFGNFGGAYTYIRYQVDDWVVNHISDYTLSTTIYATVGSDRFTGTVNRPLDRDGCITIPFNAFHGGESTIFSRGFTTSITNQKIEENFNKCYLCSIAPSEIVDFVGAMKSGLQPSNNDLWGMLNTGVIPYAIFYTSGGITAGLNDILSENSEEINLLVTAGMAKYKPYTINISCKLVDNNGNESGIFGKTFDLVSGGDVTSDTGGLVNDDPWVPDTDDPNFLPTVPDSNSTTPSAVVYTGGTFSGSFNGVIGYDPGYTELKNDVNSDPNGNFSQYLDPMHNDDVGSWFMSFVNEMPTEMKSILIAGVGVGVLFGLYRFIRRG